MAKVKRKKTSIAKKFVLLILLCISVWCSGNVVHELTQTFALKANINEELSKQAKLSKKKTTLKKDKKNLENPEYLLRYARGKYLVTKEDGEQVFKLPDADEE